MSDGCEDENIDSTVRKVRMKVVCEMWDAGWLQSSEIEINNQKCENPMNNENLKKRTKKFALAIVKTVELLKTDDISRTLGRQLLRAGTSVGANYRAVCHAKSRADFISKFGTVEEEADESGFWLELLVEAGKLNPALAAPLLREASELTAIAVSSICTARRPGGRQ